MSKLQPPLDLLFSINIALRLVLIFVQHDPFTPLKSYLWLSTTIPDPSVALEIGVGRVVSIPRGGIARQPGRLPRNARPTLGLPPPRSQLWSEGQRCPDVGWQQRQFGHAENNGTLEGPRPIVFLVRR